MSFSISAFKANLSAGRLARSSAFDIMINPARALLNGSAALTFRGCEAQLPGRQLLTHENQIYGPQRLIPYGQVFTGVPIVFYCSEDYREKKLFQRWQDLAVGKARGQNTLTTGSFDIGYYNDYVGTVDINVFDDNGMKTDVTQLIEAYPVNVADVPLSWQNDDFARLMVTFNYHYFVDDDIYSSDEAMTDGTTQD